MIGRPALFRLRPVYRNPARDGAGTLYPEQNSLARCQPRILKSVVEIKADEQGSQLRQQPGCGFRKFHLPVVTILTSLSRQGWIGP